MPMPHHEGKSIKVINRAAPVGFMFFLSYIGAAIYFEQAASNFWEVVLGLLQAAVWPVYVIYHVLRVLGA